MQSSALWSPVHCCGWSQWPSSFECQDKYLRVFQNQGLNLQSILQLFVLNFPFSTWKATISGLNETILEEPVAVLAVRRTGRAGRGLWSQCGQTTGEGGRTSKRFTCRHAHALNPEQRKWSLCYLLINAELASRMSHIFSDLQCMKVELPLYPVESRKVVVEGSWSLIWSLLAGNHTSHGQWEVF